MPIKTRVAIWKTKKEVLKEADAETLTYIKTKKGIINLLIKVIQNPENIIEEESHLIERADPWVRNKLKEYPDKILNVFVVYSPGRKEELLVLKRVGKDAIIRKNDFYDLDVGKDAPTNPFRKEFFDSKTIRELFIIANSIDIGKNSHVFHPQLNQEATKFAKWLNKFIGKGK